LFVQEHQHSNEKKRLGAVFITATGAENEPIEGVVTAMDLPKLSEHFVL